MDAAQKDLGCLQGCFAAWPGLKAKAARPPREGYPQRRLSCPVRVLEALARRAESQGRAAACPEDDRCTAREFLLQAVASKQQPVPIPLWIAYHDWVYLHVTGTGGRWHRFAFARALGLPGRDAEDVTGGDAADVLSCLAGEGLLGVSCAGATSPEAALEQWLKAAFMAFNGCFLRAQGRVFAGLTSDKEAQWSGDYDFIQLADPQLGMLHSDDGWREERTMLLYAIHHINRLQPRFVLVSGDLINAFPSGSSAAQHVASREVASFKEVFMEVDPSIPLVVQPGNHDIGQTPRPEDVARYIECFGDDYFSFWVGGVFYLSINSQYYMDSEHTENLRKKQDKWIARELADAARSGKAVHVVVLSHVPPFVGSVDEAQGWANWELEPRRRILAAAQEAGVKLWLCGHYHGNSEIHVGGLQIVITASCATNINWIRSAEEVATQRRPDFKTSVGDPPLVVDANHSGLRIFRVRKSGIEHRWFSLSSVPETCDDAFAKALVPRKKTSLGDVLLGLS